MSSKFLNFKKLFVPACLLAMTMVTAQAATINGELNFTGVVRVTSNAIDFLPLGPPDGLGNITPPDTGSFAGLEGSTLRVRDIVAVPPGPVDPDTTGKELLYNFSGLPGVVFNMNFLVPGNIPGTPFLLVDNGNGTGSNASFAVKGIFTDGSSSPVSNGVGIFTTQFPGLSSAQVLAQLAANGFIEKSFSATFIATSVPEPGTTSLLLGGLVCIGASILRRRR